MFRTEIKFNGRKITSSSQFEREIKKSMNKHVEKELRKAVGAGTRLKKTKDGFVVEGSPQQIERIKKRLK